MEEEHRAETTSLFVLSFFLVGDFFFFYLWRRRLSGKWVVWTKIKRVPMFVCLFGEGGEVR